MKMFLYSQLHECIPVFLTKLIFSYVSDQIYTFTNYLARGQGITSQHVKGSGITSQHVKGSGDYVTTC